MAYVYLMDMYKFIGERLAGANQSLADEAGEPNQDKFHEGRVDVLKDFKQYLVDNFNPKLPRRIRESYERDKKQ